MTITDLEVKKELANSLTHLFGILFGIVSIPVLIAYATQSGNHLAVIGSCVFGFSFLMVFTSSTLYHSISEPGVKSVLRTIDHISIYFLIAGSYTPFVLLYMFDDRGILMLGMQWGLTLIGIVFNFFYAGKFNLLSTLVYVLMG